MRMDGVRAEGSASGAVLLFTPEFGAAVNSGDILLRPGARIDGEVVFMRDSRGGNSAASSSCRRFLKDWIVLAAIISKFHCYLESILTCCATL